MFNKRYCFAKKKYDSYVRIKQIPIILPLKETEDIDIDQYQNIRHSSPFLYMNYSTDTEWNLNNGPLITINKITAINKMGSPDVRNGLLIKWSRSDFGKEAYEMIKEDLSVSRDLVEGIDIIKEQPKKQMVVKRKMFQESHDNQGADYMEDAHRKEETVEFLMDGETMLIE